MGLCCLRWCSLLALVSVVTVASAVMSLALAVAKSLVSLLTVAERVATVARSWAVAVARLAMASTVSCW